jgi:cell division protein FtsL
MTAARKTQNGAKAGARRASSTTRKAPARASRRAPATKRTTSSAKRKPSTRTPARRTRTDHRVLTVILLGTLVLAAWTLYPVLRLQYQQQREKTTLEQELAGLKDRNENLRAQVDRLKTPEGVEEAARSTLGLVKEGEEVYVVSDGESTRAPAPEIGEQTRSITASETSVWTKVLDAVFGFR